MPGVYISYPFCQQKCTFCNFASSVGDNDARRRYQAALLDEIRGHVWEWQPETLYFGGGTPSLLDGEMLEQILDALPVREFAESTMECAPGTVTGERLRGWRAGSINRVSLGVQSFEPAELRQTGRRHNAEIVAADIKMLRAEGLSNVNVDLIAGLPHQTRASWERSLAWIERLDVPHVSVYLFEVDEDSRLGNELILGGTRYGAGNVPTEDEAASFYERAVERLAAWGYEHYEISNFARPGWRSRHNLKYWQLEPYAGFGLDAHSFDGRMRWSNPDQLADYLARASAGKRSATDQEEERFFVGLRLLAGIHPTEAEWDRFREPVKRFTEAGMLIREGDLLRLSARGVLLSNEIFQEFVNA